MTRYVFITGGVVSSLGKGVAAAALGALFQSRGYKVRLRKLDPYLNIDPGTMSPSQHGEVFVTDDGTEADLDLGHYERFTDVPATRADSITSGRIYWDILNRERRGDYLGGTVQVIPHVTGAIKDFIRNGSESADFVIAEVGGTVGDIEALPFFEAIRQFSREAPRGTCAFVHLTLMPYVAAAGEIKTKPTQHSVKELRAIGIQPDVLLCRIDRELSQGDRNKLALFCDVRPEAVIPAYDVPSIYDVPMAYHRAGLDREVLEVFGLADERQPQLSQWTDIMERIHSPERNVRIGVVGKYDLKDAYKSIAEALDHGGLHHRAKVDVEWIDSQTLETGDPAARLNGLHGILVPGGFGARGTEGKIVAANHARRTRTPYLGICLGMQMAVVEGARNLLGITDAGSSEFEGTGTAVIGLMTEWANGDSIERRNSDDDLGGTLRRGAYRASLVEGSRMHAAYGALEIDERHRHRYEMNAAFAHPLAEKGMRVTAWSPDGRLPEAVEVDDHPWFVGVQYHPELKSRPFSPAPLFSAFVGAALEQSSLL